MTPDLKPLSYDTETTSRHLHRGGWMFAFSLCDGEGVSTVHRIDGSPIRQMKNKRHLRATWHRQDVEFVMHNLKFDVHATELELKEDLMDRPMHDTSLQSAILQSNHPTHRLKDLAWELAGFPKDDERAIKRFLTSKEAGYHLVPERLMEPYQHGDAQRAMLLHLFLYPKIQANPLWLEDYKVEVQLAKDTLRMEQRGVMLARKRCEATIVQLQKDVRGVEQQFINYVQKETGKRFTPSQTERVAWLLFEHLKLPVLERTKTGLPSTEKDEVLLPLREEHPHPVLDMILKYRSWKRGVTLLGSYLDFADEDDIIHPSIRTSGAKTGRESCADPNLHGVEKPGVLKNPFPVPARRCFRPRPGYVNFHMDYSGIEMRLLIHYSRDKRMIEELNRPGGDVHALAAIVFYPAFTPEERDEYPNVDEMIKMGFERWTPEDSQRSTLRGSAKNTNFAVPYGAAAKKAANTLNLPFALGSKRYGVYKKMFPDLCGLSDKIKKDVLRDGYVLTAFGRRIYASKHTPYVGTNYLIQGTAAGIIKRAQIRTVPLLQKLTGGAMKVLLPIHDELIIECPRELLPQAREVFTEVRRVMIDFPQFNVPLEVEFSTATVDWSIKKKYKL